jgi:hypothetical protein
MNAPRACPPLPGGFNEAGGGRRSLVSSERAQGRLSIGPDHPGIDTQPERQAMRCTPLPFIRQFLGVVAATLVPVVLVAFVSIPFTLGGHPGEGPPRAAAHPS